MATNYIATSDPLKRLHRYFKKGLSWIILLIMQITIRFKPLVSVMCVFTLFILSACEYSESENQQEAVEMLVQSSETNGLANHDWAYHGLTPKEQRFAQIDTINDLNVESLGVAWYSDIKTRSKRGVETTPIVVDGVMYLTGPWNVVMAIDAVTGQQLWEYNPKISGATARKACCDVVNRGVAVSQGKVITGLLDGRLIALDQQTGKVVWEITTVDPEKNYTITGAPRIAGDLVIIGNGGAEYGVRGYVTAYNINTGKQVWRFYTVPGNPVDGFESSAMEMAAKTWTGEWWKYGGGGTAWDSMAYDKTLDLLYIGTGNGSPWNQSIRSPQGGDNLFLSSIVAVRPATGEYVWHFQTTPEDQWDYTATQHMILAELEIDGKLRKVLMQAPKNGFFYVLDRETGEFISGNNYVPVSWAKGLDAKTGYPNIVSEARYSKTGKPFLGTPSPAGGHSWQPMSFNPTTGLVYFAAMEMPYGYTGVKAEDFVVKPKGWNTGEDVTKSSMPEDPAIRAQIRSMMKGKLLAWDPVKQKEAWSVPMAVPWNGGTLTTSGNLVFQGNGEGYFNAYAADTGKLLWSKHMSTGIVAPPITFVVDGTQYVSIATGWGGILTLNLGEPLKSGSPPSVNRIVTFKLNGNADLPRVEKQALTLDPPKHQASEDDIAQGRIKYHEACWMCHGDTGVNNGGVPNLRYSRTIGSEAAFSAFVLGGVAEQRGMPNFSDTLELPEVELIRAYLIKRANDLKENPDLP